MKKLYFVLPAAVMQKVDEHKSIGPALIAGFQALWHPSLLLASDGPPVRREPGEAPDAEDWLATIPGFVAAQLTNRPVWMDAGKTILSIENEQGGLGGPDSILAPLQLPACDDELRRDFYALGFAYFWLESLFQRMGQENPIDGWAIHADARQAAEHLLAGDHDQCREHLQKPFDSLLGARQMVYPATINLIDLALWPPGVLKEQFERRIAFRAPFNALLSADDVERLALVNPELLALLRTGLENQELEVLGGTTDGRPWSLLSLEQRIWQFEHAAGVYSKRLGRELDCFGSRTLALTPELPQLLMKFQYRYALHATFDGGKTPHFREPKLHWTAPDGNSIETLARASVDAGSEKEVFPALAALARTLDKDRGPTVVLAHWFGQEADWMGWLYRVHQYAAVFGKFQTMSDFFLNSSFPDHPTTTRPEEYASEYLSAAAHRNEANPIGRWIDGEKRRGRLDAAAALAGLAAVSSGVSRNVAGELADIENLIETSPLDETAQSRLDLVERDSFAQLADVILSEAEPRPGYLVFNPCSFPRRACLSLDDLALGVAEAPVKAMQADGKRTAVVVDVPGWGYAWFPRRAEKGSKTAVKETPLASGRRLRNDLIEAEIDSRTGGLRGVWDTRTGYSRFGEQLVHSAGSRMVSTSQTVTAAGPAFGEIVALGDLFAEGSKKKLASFRQTFRIWRGRPILEIAVQLSLHVEPKGDPQTDYYALRWAWPDEKTLLSIASGTSLQVHRATDLESPRLLEFRERNLITSLLPHGLAFHRRIGPRMADTILAAAGESRRDFNLSLALDYAYPMTAAQETAWPVLVQPVEKGPPRAGRTGWLAKLNLPDVLCAGLRPLEGNDVGVLMRFVETAGKMGRAELRFCRDPRTARLVNGRNELIYELYPVGDALPLDFSAHELQQVELRFHEPAAAVEPLVEGD